MNRFDKENGGVANVKQFQVLFYAVLLKQNPCLHNSGFHRETFQVPGQFYDVI